MKKENRTQVMKRLDKIMAEQAKGQFICRTCAESGCCQLAHDNMGPFRKGDRFEKDGEVYTL